MIKIYSKEELGLEVYEDDEVWSYPINELDYLSKVHNGEEFILYDNRLYEKDPIVHNLEIYVGVTDMPSRLRQHEGNEKRKELLYRMYCSNPNREEMRRITLEELINYIRETDEYWEDEKYIFKECARLCGASEELLNEIERNDENVK